MQNQDQDQTAAPHPLLAAVARLGSGGSLRQVAATIALSWGISSTMRAAEEAQRTTAAAAAQLAAIEETIEERQAVLAGISEAVQLGRAALDGDREAVDVVVQEAIASGRFDHVVLDRYGVIACGDAGPNPGQAPDPERSPEP